ncbi:MAG TPA: biotin--[acetyl-CoA-carboxylase] ligase [Bryobacteraceae bacterium]|nr:biotin--[acetyl-CoA-carboxylase] ligase [Bryobacteraceae bacterium]
MPLDIEAVRVRLPGWRIEWFDTIPSTMSRAAKIAQDGCEGGALVGADEQSAGIGRQGHSWHSEKDTGLYVSMVLRLAPGLASGNALPVAMLALGLATQEAIADVSGLAPDLRWPNDILIRGSKCAGILAQIEAGAIVAGIGINVSQTSFPNDLATPATSLRLSGANVSREDLLVVLVQSVERYCKILAEDGPGAILRAFEASSSYARGRRVRAEQGGRMVEGTTRGLDASGFLIVRQDDGREATILAGGVRPV